MKTIFFLIIFFPPQKISVGILSLFLDSSWGWNYTHVSWLLVCVAIFMTMKIWSIMHDHIRSSMLFPFLFLRSHLLQQFSEENVVQATSHTIILVGHKKKRKKSLTKKIVSKYFGIFTVFSLDECKGGSFFNEFH